MKNWKQPFCNVRALAFAMCAVAALPAVHGNAQTQTPSLPSFSQGGDYIDYPQTRGKVQPFHIAGMPSWLTFDFQLRDRLESQAGYQYLHGNNRVYDLTRVWGGVTVRPTRWLTGYMQFMDNHALGLPVAHVAANMRDDFDLRQGYLEFHTGPVQLYGGRRELRFGNERVVGISDYTNNSRTWDGFFGTFNLPGKKNSIDVFSTSVVAISPESLDKHGAGLTFHGIYGTFNSFLPKNTTLQPFVLVKAEPRVKSNQGIFGTETETTFGIEGSGKLPYGFNYDVLADLQRGSYSNNSIHAGADIEKVYYTFHKLPWQPRLGGEYDYATGNTKQNPNRISTYDQQYPSNHNAFGFVDLFGFQNIKMQRVNLDLGPTKNLTVLVQGEALGVASRHDSIYSSSGSSSIAVPTGGFKTNSIGDGFDLSGKYLFHDYLVFNAAYSHYFPGSLMSAAGKGVPLNYAMFSMTYRFRVDK
jgi:hypothetical protein